MSPRADTPPMLPIAHAEQLMLELVHLALPGVYRRRDALRLDLAAGHVELRLRQPGVDPMLPPDCSAILTHDRRDGEAVQQWCTTAAEAVLMMRGILDEYGGEQ